MAISLNQHREHITKRIIATFSDNIPVRSGLSAFFPASTTVERMVGIEVERNRQLVAVDVRRSTDANRNKFSKFLEKLYEPPFFNESWDFTTAQRYDVTFGATTNPSKPDALNMMREANNKMTALRNRIERAIQIQHAQVLQTGIVTMKNGDNVDYKRKATSLVALGAGARWNEGTSDPLKDLADGCEFLREEGLAAGNTVNAIMGRDAFANFISNDKVQKNADFRNIKRVEIGMPQFDNTTGLSFQSQIGTADYIVNIWTYNEFFETDAGVKTKYIDVKNCILISDDFVGKTAFAGIPAIKRDKSNAEYPAFITPIEADFYINNYIDPVKKAHWFEIASAPLAIPVSVDRMYTIQTLA